MKNILMIIFALLGLCAIGASVTSTEIGNLHDYNNVVTNVDLTGLAASKDLETVKTNAIVKNRDNVVSSGFSIKQPSEYGGDISLSFGENDPSGPSIVMNKLYSTAPSSFFSGSIAFIPETGEKTSMLSRIHEYSSASWNARKEVESIVSSAMLPTNQTFSNAVLAVGLNIDTNSVAVLNDIADTFGGFPIEGTATTVGGLLAALAAAVAWLKKNKADKEHTHEVSDVTGLQSAIDSLQTEVSTKASTDDLNTAKTELQNAINANNTALDELKSQVSTANAVLEEVV